MAGNAAESLREGTLNHRHAVRHAITLADPAPVSAVEADRVNLIEVGHGTIPVRNCTIVIVLANVSLGDVNALCPALYPHTNVYYRRFRTSDALLATLPIRPDRPSQFSLIVARP